jgi:hypothetical protein
MGKKRVDQLENKKLSNINIRTFKKAINSLVQSSYITAIYALYCIMQLIAVKQSNQENNL